MVLPGLRGLLADQNPGGVSVGGVTGVVVVLGLAAATLLSLLLIFGVGRGRTRRLTTELAADVEHGLVLLAAQLEEVRAPAADSGGQLALHDAQERLAAARGLHAEAPARSLPVLRALRHMLLEGLAAAHEARRSAGLDPGPVPPPPTDAPLVGQASTVQVAGVSREAHPTYVPGAVHHFGGGRLAGLDVPGGWYAEAFWVPLLEQRSDQPT